MGETWYIKKKSLHFYKIILVMNMFLCVIRCKTILSHPQKLPYRKKRLKTRLPTAMFRQQAVVDEPEDDPEVIVQQGHHLDPVLQLHLT